MILKNYYWFFENAFSENECNHIIKLGNNTKLELGNIDGSNKDKKVRDSHVGWLYDKWIYDRLSAHLNLANKNAEWNFNISAMEVVQFTKYGKQQHYDWHTDADEKIIKHEDPNLNNKYRKISMSLLLNDPKEYKGGELHFQILKKDKKLLMKNKNFYKKGTLVVFPSFVWHKVTPVTKGCRYSLVCWSVGEPFK